MRVTAFSEIEADFLARVREIVWCNVATVDRRGRPRSRILHPIWEGATGWILTDPHSAKERHLAGNPYVSLCYSNANLGQVYAECLAEWEDRPAEKARLWDLFAQTPPPVGYDPIAFWPGGKDDPRFGVLRLVPWRIEVTSLGDLIKGGGKTWQRE
jgi:general stress protein 26